tara:strand:- start:171 stop:341 length:171 start_codon:yes stop_codon:yes gene_type:complete
MRVIFFIFFIILLSCSKDINKKKTINIDINDDLTFNEFKKLIEEKGLKKGYPNINQ